MTKIVSISRRQDKEDELLAAQLVFDRTRRLQEANAVHPDTEAPQKKWQQYVHGADIYRLPTASHNAGRVVMKGAVTAAEIIDIRGSSPIDSRPYTAQPTLTEPHSQNVAT